MRRHAGRAALILSFALVLLTTAIGGAEARPAWHRKTAPVWRDPLLRPADRLLADSLMGQLARQAGWGQADLTTAQWDAMIALARQFQRARPQVVKAVLAQVMRVMEKGGPGEAGPGGGEMDQTSPLLLLRVMFIYPDTPLADGVIFNFGPNWVGVPLGNGFVFSFGSGQTIPAWPVAWRDGRPHLTAALEGAEGLPVYDSYDEYIYAYHHFPPRDLSKVDLHTQP